MINFLAYLSKMKHIKRWGLMRNTREEKRAGTQLAGGYDRARAGHRENALFGGNVDVRRVLELALFHEAGEVITDGTW